MRARGVTWDSNTCHEAAKNGHLDILKYAHENGCAWNLDTTTSAAVNGHLECFQYAIEQGCLWRNDVSFVADGGQLPVRREFSRHLKRVKRVLTDIWYIADVFLISVCLFHTAMREKRVRGSEGVWRE